MDRRELLQKNGWTAALAALRPRGYRDVGSGILQYSRCYFYRPGCGASWPAGTTIVFPIQLLASSLAVTIG